MSAFGTVILQFRTEIFVYNVQCRGDDQFIIGEVGIRGYDINIVMKVYQGSVIA